MSDEKRETDDAEDFPGTPEAFATSVMALAREFDVDFYLVVEKMGYGRTTTSRRRFPCSGLVARRQAEEKP